MSEETVIVIVKEVCNCIFWTCTWVAFWWAVGGGCTKVIVRGKEK